MIQPFDQSGITRTADHIAHYDDLPNSLVEMLRSTVDRSPDAEAIVEIGGERVTYRELWDRSARVAGGLRDTFGQWPGMVSRLLWNSNGRRGGGACEHAL